MQTRWMIPDYAKSMAFVKVPGGWELVIEWDEKDVPKQAAIQPSVGCNLPEVNQPSAAALRQRRYRESKRNTSASVTPVTSDVTGVTRDVTRDVTSDVTNVTKTVTRDVTQGLNHENVNKEGKKEINNNLNNINNININNNHSFPSLKKNNPSESVTGDVTRDVTQTVTGDVTRNAPKGVMLSNPSNLIPASLPENLRNLPKIVNALEEYFEERCFDGKPQLWPDYENRLWVFLGKCLEKVGEDKTVEVIRWNAENKQWFTLKLPDEWTRPPEPPKRFEPPQKYDAGEDVSPEEDAIVREMIKNFDPRSLRKVEPAK